MTVKTTTRLVVTPNPAVVGQTVTLAAIVTESTAGVPKGSVTFRDGATVLGPAALDPTGRTVRTAGFTLGSHSLTATYEGDPTFAASTSPAVAVAMNQAKTTTGLVVTPNPAVIGQNVTLTATVTSPAAVPASAAGPPNGSVTFRDGATVLGPPAAVDPTGRTVRTQGFTPGPHSLTATYQGDPAHAASTSPAVAVAMNQAATKITLVATPNWAVVGQMVTLTATVTDSDDRTPGGLVTFGEGATVLGTAGLDSEGRAVWKAGFPPGSHTITAAYAGDSTFAASASPAATVNVKDAA